jgi:hypothetical protein
MSEENHEFNVPVQELGCLLALGDESLACLLRSRISLNGHGAIIKMTHAEAEMIRDRLTRRLAEIGFDENYSPNEQGQMLEALIDRFFVR